MEELSQINKDKLNFLLQKKNFMKKDITPFSFAILYFKHSLLIADCLFELFKEIR